MNYDAFFSEDARVMRSSIIRQLTGLVNRPDVISFAAGSPNAETFPYEQLTAIYEDLAAKEKGKIFQYSVTRGSPELIEAVRSRTAEVQGIAASQEQTILASGSQQGMDLLARVLLDPGDSVFVELPNFIGASSSFENLRASVVGIRRDDEGMDLDDLRGRIAAARAKGSRPKLIYVIPNFQNPSGRTWSQARRRALLEVATEENLLILEDDAYGEIYFEGDGSALIPIKRDDPDCRVIYMSTFSKTLAAGLRVAWITGPAEIVRRVELAKETADLCSPTLSQKLTLEFLRRGWMEAHLEKVRAFYRGKRDIMLSVVEKRFGDIAEWSRPGGGLFLWVELPRQIDTLPLLREVVDTEKIAFIPGQPFFVDGSGSNTLRLSFSNVSDENIDKGLERLERVVRARLSAASKA
jgi:2-aminoadipate transaminase